MRRTSLAVIVAVAAIMVLSLMLVPLVGAATPGAPALQATGTAATTAATAAATTTAATAAATADTTTGAATPTRAPTTLPATGGDSGMSTLLLGAAALVLLGAAAALLMGRRRDAEL